MLWTRCILETYSLETKEKCGGANMQKKEKQFSIKFILWKILSDWKFLLIFAVIFTILFSGVNYIREWKNYNQKSKEQTLVSADKELTFSEEEKNQIQTAELLQKLIDERLEYTENSIKMNINASEENVLVMTWYIASGYQFNYTEDISPNYTDALVAAYEQYIQGGALVQKISQDMNLEYSSEYVNEMLQIQNPTNSTVITLEIAYPDTETLQKMATEIDNVMHEKSEEISEYIGNHTIQLISTDIVTKSNENLAEYQQSVCDELASYQEKLDAIEKQMSEEQLNTVNLDEKMQENQQSNISEGAGVKKPQIEKKKIVIGFLIGIFIGVVLIVCKVIFSSKLQSSDELEELYGVRELGVIQCPARAGIINKKLLDLKNHGKQQLPIEEGIRFILSSIVLECERKKCTTIYLTGSKIKKIEGDVVKYLIQGLETEGIKVVYGENIVSEPEDLRKMSETGNVVLVEQTSLSTYQEIEKELRTIEKQNVEIIGGVIVDTVF